MIRTIAFAGLLGMAATASVASAEVLQASDSGFVTHDSVLVEAGPDAVWQMLIRPEQWWNGEHSWSTDATNFALDPVPGGCFCEMLGDGGFAQHMQVIHARPGAMLRMAGALGPLQSEALDGVLTIELKPAANGGTTIGWTYVVGGYARYPLEQIAAPVDAVQSEQLHRLARLIETGDPAPAEAASPAQ